MLITHLFALVGVGTVVVALPVIAVMRVLGGRRRAARTASLQSALEAVTTASWGAENVQEIVDIAVEACTDALGTQIHGDVRRAGDGQLAISLTTSRTLDRESLAFLHQMRRTVAHAVERHSLTAQLADIGSTDPLTGLPNAVALDNHLTRALARGAAATQPVAVLACDVEDLAALNDRWGRGTGDQALLALAELASSSTPTGTFVARTGGSQFTVVLEAPQDAATVLDIARTLRRGAAVPGAPAANAQTTVGVVIWEPHRAPEVDPVLRDVGFAVDLARTAPSGLVVYEERLRAQAEDVRTRTQQLGDALLAGEIVTVFQPQVDARSLTVVGLEALVRWRRDGRLVTPARWLRLAEQTGLVVPLGAEVLRQARVAHDRWRVPVSVNVAIAQLESPSFVDDARRAWGDDRWEHLTIEVTESAALFDSLHVRSALIAMSSLGARIAIDDFGTGYNSLARLGQLPLDELKVDRSFVEAVTTEEGAAVVRAIVALADALGLDVVAEGVERPEQLAALGALGVRTLQGYMLGRPRADVSNVVERSQGPRPRGLRRRPYVPQRTDDAPAPALPERLRHDHGHVHTAPAPVAGTAESVTLGDLVSAAMAEATGTAVPQPRPAAEAP